MSSTDFCCVIVFSSNSIEIASHILLSLVSSGVSTGGHARTSSSYRLVLPDYYKEENPVIKIIEVNFNTFFQKSLNTL